MTIVHQVHDSDMPYLFQAADRASQHGQKSYVGTTGARLVLLGSAALFGVFSWKVNWGETGSIDVLALGGVLAFIVSLVFELNTWRSRPDKAWYNGRAVAESAKTLAWKFAIGGKPFPLHLDMDDARRALLVRLDSVQKEFPELELAPLNAPAISNWMIDQRQSSLDDRRETYLKARIDDQKSWYEGRAKFNKKRAAMWRGTLITLEIVGAGLSLAAAVSQDVTQVSSAVATFVTAVVAWTQTKQHDFNASAYSAAIADLANAEEKLRLATTETSWSNEVDDAEEAISREHVVWMATRSRL